MSGKAKKKSPWRHTRNVMGYRPDLGRAFRSALEADMARFLNELLRRRLVQKWEYEPERFVFHHNGKRVAYIPDFRVTMNNGDSEYWETKGKFDPASRMKVRLAREAGHKVLVIRRKHLEGKKSTMNMHIPHWEG